MAVSYKQNDTTPPYVVALKDVISDVETTVDLTLASSAKFLMRQAGGSTVKVNATATISDAANGEVTYTWGTADLDTAGNYDAEVQITWASGKVETFPNSTYNRIRVLDDIG